MPRNDDDETTGLLTCPEVSPSKGEEYRSRALELANLISVDELPGGRIFSELSLYEKKSVLVNHELE